jgi:dimethylargininase
MLALTHVPSPRMDLAQRTHVPPAAIDYERAVRQHAEYCRMLQRCGVAVHTLDVNRDLPDCVFVEDTAVVLDEVAVLAWMGAPSRRAEPAGIEPELRKYRAVCRIEAPATLEGGDVLQVGRTLLVGLSARTNKAGVSALEQIVRRHGYSVVPLAVRNCLHLKTACTALPDQSLLVNPAWLDKQGLQGFELIPIPDTEPWAANTLPIGERVCVAAAHGHTAELIRRRGFAVETIDLSEFAKAEGGITCSSILLN